MDNIVEMTVNAMFYAYCVILAGGLGLVTASLIGFKAYKVLDGKEGRKVARKPKKQQGMV